MRTGARATKQNYISIYISLYMKNFLKTGVYTSIYICCVKKRYSKKAVFLYRYIFVKGQLFYKNIFCKKTVIL